MQQPGGASVRASCGQSDPHLDPSGSEQGLNKGPGTLSCHKKGVGAGLHPQQTFPPCPWRPLLSAEAFCSVMEKSLGADSPTAAWPAAAEAKPAEEAGGLEGPSGIPLAGLREPDRCTKRQWSSGTPKQLVHGWTCGWLLKGHQQRPRDTFPALFRAGLGWSTGGGGSVWVSLGVFGVTFGGAFRRRAWGVGPRGGCGSGQDRGGHLLVRPL